jgi:tRNA1(Val) A37 N6-methylase TrmN6
MWPALHRDLEAELGEPVTIDALTGQWRIAQRAAGHRHSSDDVLTAHYALRTRPRAERALDLGAGLGGVGLLTLWGLSPAARLVCVEAQAASHRLLVANIAGNGLAARCEARLGDLRELALPERFPLVTGSPPYFPLGTGVVPADTQKAHARFELRGDVADYARAAARHLTADGAFVFCFPSAQRGRARSAVAGAGLALIGSRDVVPRAGRPPLFTLFAAVPAAAAPPGVGATEAPALVVRESDGSLSAEMRGVRRAFGFA